jgi:DNA ligase-associated metallophosphoesterase
MPALFEREIAGQTLHFLADRALYWPARQRLLIADLHLGKGDVFRVAGIAVPSGGTAHDLDRLDALLRLTSARQLWILGDFLHGPRSGAVEVAWRQLLRCHRFVTTSVIGGNHDRALDPAALQVTLLPEDVDDGPFRFRHHPRARAEASEQHVLCGHLHPVVLLPGLPGRFPAFVLDRNQTVLPAFSRFTGGMVVDDPARRWIACAQGELLENRR